MFGAGLFLVEQKAGLKERTALNSWAKLVRLDHFLLCHGGDLGLVSLLCI